MSSHGLKKYNVMLAKAGTIEDLDKTRYYFEPKLDGIRALIYKKDKEIVVSNRKGTIITAKYPELNDLSAFLCNDCLLDGEIVVYNKNGKPDFHTLLKREQSSPGITTDILRKHNPATYVAFDILEKNGKDLRSLPLEKRKEILRQSLRKTKEFSIIPFTEHGKKLWNLIRKEAIEGVIAKRKESRYVIGRSSEWKKIKTARSLDCLVIGYMQQKRAISSLALGLYEENSIVFIGKVGTGFSEETIRHLASLLSPCRPGEFALPALPEDVTPVKPELICEVHFLEVTADKKLRQPVFHHLRYDKLPKECTWDQR